MPSEGLSARRITQVLQEGFADSSAGPRRRLEQAALVDGWLTELWAGAGGPASGAALGAIGSLGRRDLGPASDLDLVLLIDPDRLDQAETNRLANALWYPIWDSGTSLDHAVRSPEECDQVARDDLRAAISLLDLRVIAGDSDLVEDTAHRVRMRWRREARRRVSDLVDLAMDRGHRYGSLAHSSEPNLKSDRGGLRDVTVIRALAESWLADHDHEVVDAAARTLGDARDALQAVTGTAGTRLGRADQDSVAALTGHATADDHHAVLAEAARAVSWELHRTVRAAEAALAPGGSATRGTGSDRRPALTRLPHGVLVQAGEVSVDPSTRDLLRDLAAVRHAATTGLPLADATLARMADADTAPLVPAQRDVLVDSLAGEHFAQVYEALDVKGIFARWVPGWAEVRNRPQRSAVHRFTVDRHLVETVLESQRFLARVGRPDLLLVAALLHDLGKRSGARDHAAEGAPLAETAARHLGFDKADSRAIALLVREHLTLIRLATGRDLADPATLRDLLDAIDHDPEVLELLRALTEADAVAAGPAAWSTWRADLVDHLTDLARDALSGTAPAPRIVLSPQRSVQDAVRTAVQRTGSAQVVYPAHTEDEPISQICVGAPDGDGVFAAMARVLVRLRLDVHSAVVGTQDGVAVNTWWVAAAPADLPHPSVLRSALDRELAVRDRPDARVLELPPAPPPRTTEDTPVVTLLPGASREATVVQVNARNRPSLLADVAEVITVHRLQVRSAHVLTLGRRAVDVLYLTDQHGRGLDPPTVGRIVTALMDAAAT
ncbi:MULTISPECIES: HD domain-containing protein [Brachybacterium]|uniref:[protein-PII] uridylyltransferase family protein n=1 Tax=Brachybacterium TaxID=43668 RepID=UPI000DF32EDC|nr:MULTISPECIES: HD domain-containing protein [Brachybacterium]RCS62406.1 HD domain-containing protein [Brachybacterium sp. JB7]RCS69106.1 HD domain-containing protein [Brachybacterium alimentarium]RCS76279.1 HD domain-containing protein [Brachybacterium alimentarium]RCS80824.1 HD domain-containing protein [Brachybacterium alimentarium]RCS85962.1 HD domain-containing protein [Brachybacterium alimentarium]